MVYRPTVLLFVISMVITAISQGCRSDNHRDKQLDAELMSATANNDIKEVGRLLDSGADINARSGYNSDDGTPLTTASEDGYLSICELLIKRGAKLDAEDDDGQTALSLAVMYGQRPVVNLLLSKGAERSQIHRASLLGDLSTVNKLAAHGVNINRADQNGCTPLLLAAMTGRDNVVHSLLAKGADPNKQDRLGFTPLYLAARFGHLKVVKELVQSHAEINVSHGGLTAAGIAETYVHDDIVEYLTTHDNRPDRK